MPVPKTMLRLDLAIGVKDLLMELLYMPKTTP